MAEQDKNLSGGEKRLIADGFAAAAADLESHKAALSRLAENQEAEHALVAELAKMVNEHTGLLEAYRAAATTNFENFKTIVDEQSKAILALRDLLLLPPTANKPGPVN
jgi:hypothetical protein